MVHKLSYFLLITFISCQLSAKPVIDGFNGYKWYVVGTYIKSNEHKANNPLFYMGNSLMELNVNERRKKETLGPYSIEYKNFGLDADCVYKTGCPLVQGTYSLETKNFEDVKDIIATLTQKYGSPTYSRTYDNIVNYSAGTLDLKETSKLWFLADRSAVEINVSINNKDQKQIMSPKEFKGEIHSVSIRYFSPKASEGIKNYYTTPRNVGRKNDF